MSKAAKSAPPKDFESALSELEALVEQMESGSLPLEGALSAYQRGVELTQYCQKTLNAAEQRVRQLENGELKAFEVPANGVLDD